MVFKAPVVKNKSPNKQSQKTMQAFRNEASAGIADLMKKTHSEVKSAWNFKN